MPTRDGYQTGYIVEKHARGGRVRPTRRRPDAAFNADDAFDFDQLQRLDTVEFTYSTAIDADGRRLATEVQRLVPDAPPHLSDDAALRALAWPIEEQYDARRASVADRWNAGLLSPEQRAARLVDIEYARLKRLRNLTHPRTHAEGGSPSDTTDHPQETTTMADRQAGTINRLTDRGFGFLSPSGTRRSVFFHASGVAPGDGGFDSLAEGMAVTFILAADESGRPRAVDVRSLGALESAPETEAPSEEQECQPAQS
jgi:cold shock CspA family protein